MRTDVPPAPWASDTREPSDDVFVERFESLALANDQFRHYDHVRLAWIYLRGTAGSGAFDVERATERMASGIRAFALYHSGSLEKYHATITRAFVQLVAAHMRETPDLDDFRAFAAAHPRLFDKNLPLMFYSKSRLMSAEARKGWLAPDVRALPLRAQQQTATDRTGEVCQGKCRANYRTPPG